MKGLDRLSRSGSEWIVFWERGGEPVDEGLVLLVLPALFEELVVVSVDVETLLLDGVRGGGVVGLFVSVVDGVVVLPLLEALGL